MRCRHRRGRQGNSVPCADGTHAIGLRKARPFPRNPVLGVLPEDAWRHWMIFGHMRNVFTAPGGTIPVEMGCHGL